MYCKKKVSKDICKFCKSNLCKIYEYAKTKSVSFYFEKLKNNIFNYS